MTDLFGEPDRWTITLSEFERRTLLSHIDRPCKQPGGFQGLMRKLADRVVASTDLLLERDDLRRIKHYAEYRSGGGWENDLRAIFQRHMGRQLDKDPPACR